MERRSFAGILENFKQNNIDLVILRWIFRMYGTGKQQNETGSLLEANLLEHKNTINEPQSDSSAAHNSDKIVQSQQAKVKLIL